MEAVKSKIKALADLLSADNLFPDSQMVLDTVSSHSGKEKTAV
jgi:hypothetical protein